MDQLNVILALIKSFDQTPWANSCKEMTFQKIIPEFFDKFFFWKVIIRIKLNFKFETALFFLSRC